METRFKWTTHNQKVQWSSGASDFHTQPREAGKWNSLERLCFRSQMAHMPPCPDRAGRSVCSGKTELFVPRPQGFLSFTLFFEFQISLLSVIEWKGNRQEGQGSSNGGNKLKVLDILPLSSSSRKKQISVSFFPFSIQIYKEAFLKILCFHDDTWLHLNLTFLKPGASQCFFPMELFVC